VSEQLAQGIVARPGTRTRIPSALTTNTYDTIEYDKRFALENLQFSIYRHHYTSKSLWLIGTVRAEPELS